MPATGRENPVVAALQHAGLVVSDRAGLIRVSGADRLDLLHRLSTNDLTRARAGEAISTVFTDEKGRIIDAVRIALLADSLLVLCSCGRSVELMRWIDKFVISEDFIQTDLTASRTIITLTGPEVFSLSNHWLGVEVKNGSVAGIPIGTVHALVIGSGGPLGNVIHVLLDAGSSDGSRSMLVKGAGQIGAPVLDDAALEAYRVTSGIPAATGELTRDHTPYDAGLYDLISFTKGCYIGQEVIARLHTYHKVRRGLAGIWTRDADERAAGQPLLVEGEEIGRVTSVSPLVLAGRRTALAVVRNDRVQPGDRCRTTDGAEWTVASLPQKPWVS
jgi:folate-binding protein YgfZ